MRTTGAIGIGLALLAACLGASLASRGGGLGLRRGPAEAQDQQPIDQRQVLQLAAVRAPQGLGEAALRHVEQVVGFGARHSGTPGWSQQVEYIHNELQKHGLAVERDTWTDRKERKTFTNLRAVLPGKRPERILLACHHDTKCTTGHQDPAHNFHFVGANDGGSAVGLLLALAPHLAAAKREATLELVFFDGEESLDWAWNDAARALFGSRRYVQRHRDQELLGKAPRIAALLLLDMVGRTDLHLQEELYSTPRLRQILWSAAVACGHQAHVFRRAEAASDDHKPFLDVGIPAVDLIDLNGNPYWHTKDDTLQHLSAASLQTTADLVLTMLPEVERAYVLGKD